MKYIYTVLLSLISLLFASSCSVDDYADKYTDPSKTDKVSCDRLMTGVLFAGRTYTLNAYWRVYVFDNPVPGKYSQTIGFQNNDNGNYYAPNDSYVGGFWGQFYEMLAQYRLLQKTYSELSEADQKDQKIFKDLAEVFLYDHLSRRVDFFGDMPFSTAGFLGVTGSVVESYATYDKASDIYIMMLDRLDKLATEIAVPGELSPMTKKNLPKQDFLNNGNLSKWELYANGLRLRIAIRLSSQGELSEKARAIVAEILDKNKVLPTSVDNMIVLTMEGKEHDFVNPTDFKSGYIDHSYASQKMLDVLTTSLPNELDPRTPIMYSTNAKGAYKGYSRTETLKEQEINAALPEENRAYSRIDSTTVMENRNFLSPIISAAEMDFCKAEAYENGWAKGNAKEAFINGISNSVDYYFKQYGISPYENPKGRVEKPAKADVIAYAEKLWDANTNKLELIITQKWLNFGYMQSSEAWHEICRTGYPKLDYLYDKSAAEYKTAPYRLKYPQTEKANNTKNYQTQIDKMGGKDDPYLKLMWQKEIK